MSVYHRNFRLTSVAVIVLFLGSGFSTVTLGGANVNFGDLKVYEALTKHLLHKLDDGKSINIDNVMAMHVKLINLGSNACREYALTKPVDSRLMNLVTSNAQNMQKMSLNDMRVHWHEDAAFIEKGIEVTKLKYSSVTRSLIDTVIHPATSFIALNNYKKTFDQKYLTQARVELQKSLDHLYVIQ